MPRKKSNDFTLVVMLAILFLVVVVAFSRFGTQENFTAADQQELEKARKEADYLRSLGLNPGNNEAAKKVEARLQQLHAKLNASIVSKTMPPTIGAGQLVTADGKVVDAPGFKDGRPIGVGPPPTTLQPPLKIGPGQMISPDGKVVDLPGFKNGQFIGVGPTPSQLVPVKGQPMPEFTVNDLYNPGGVPPMPGSSVGPTAMPAANSTGAQLALLKTMELVEYLKALINNKK
jgi:hypothetical protein